MANLTSRADRLRARITMCESHKRAIETRVRELEAEPDAAEKIRSYLGEKGYDEWLMTYDSLIAEAKEELLSLNAEPTDNQALLFASGITAVFFLLIVLFFLPKPLAVLTGNVIGASGSTIIDAPFFFATFLFLATIFLTAYGVLRKSD